jgi:hypothetical protein
MDEKIDKLDKALSEYLENKQALPEELHTYRKTLTNLELLRDVPERDPDVKAAARGLFLEKAKSMPVPVSKPSKRRLIGWNTFFRRERSPMTTIVGFILALVVAFGGAGTTAYAAQDSLPNEPLYPVKQLTEQLRIALTTDKEAEVDLLLDLAQERVGEMMALANMGMEIPEQTQLRLQEHLQFALSETAQLGDAALMGALEQIQNMVQNQIKTMQQAQQNIPEDLPREQLQIAISAMNQVRQEAEDGLVDPTTFRNRQGTNRPDNAPDQPDNSPPNMNNRNESTSDEGITGYGDGTGDGGDANGSGYGDGTGDGGDANGSGYGDGTGDGGDAYGNGYGTGDGGGAYGDGNGDGICDCTCDNSKCDCSNECMPQSQQNGPQGPKGGDH